MRILVRLEASDGTFVAHGEIAPFAPLPRVVVWGARCFTLHDEGLSGAAPTYREAFTVAVVGVLPP